MKRQALALEEAVERPDFAGAQTLKTNAHSGGLFWTAWFDPTNLARHLDGFGLGRDFKADLQLRLQRKGLFGFHKETTQGNVPCGCGACLITYDELNV